MGEVFIEEVKVMEVHSLKGEVKVDDNIMIDTFDKNNYDDKQLIQSK